MLTVLGRLNIKTKMTEHKVSTKYVSCFSLNVVILNQVYWRRGSETFLASMGAKKMK